MARRTVPSRHRRENHLRNKPLNDKNTLRGPWKAALNLFILWHLLVLTLWNLPPSPMRDKLIRGKIAQYMHLTGLRQWWAMFYSGGAQINWHLEAEITYKNSDTRRWVFPRMDELSIPDRFLKILHGTWKAYLPQHKEAWPDTSRYIARIHNDTSGNPPKKIVLVQWWGKIPQPMNTAQPIRWQKIHPVRKELYTYTVKKGDL